MIDAIDSLDPDDPTTDDDLIEELGDLLYQVEFHATIAEQEGRFTIADVASGIHDKLVRRHPHVFGDLVGSDLGTNEVLANWDDIKHAEKSRSSVFDGIPRSMPALAYAAKVGGKASKVGFDWPERAGRSDLRCLAAKASRRRPGPASSRRRMPSKRTWASRPPFDVVPVGEHLVGTEVDPDEIAEHVRVPSARVVVDSDTTWRSVNVSFLLGDRGVELDLVEQVAEFLDEVVVVGSSGSKSLWIRIDHLVGLLLSHAMNGQPNRILFRDAPLVGKT